MTFIGNFNGQRKSGFTVIELLVVIGVVAMLAAMALPALARTRPRSQSMQCVRNLNQLSMGWIMYTSDNQDRIIGNPGWVGGTMDWTSSTFNTNTAILTDTSQSPIANYVKGVHLYKCPADNYQSSVNPGPRVRSVSLNGVLTGGGGSGPSVQGNNPPGRRYYGSGATGVGIVRKLSDLNLPGPARTLLLLDEHPDSINDATFFFDPGYAQGGEKWRDLPGSYHNGACTISFTDGHVEIHKWQDSRTVQPVTYGAAGTPWRTLLVVSVDYEWMQDRMPYREQ